MGDLDYCISKLKIDIKNILNIENNPEKFGIGVDIENIKRFEPYQHKKDSLFLNRLYTNVELDYCFSKKEPAPHLTVRFAAKEAIYKAINSVEKKIIDFQEIEIWNDENGIPKVKFLKKDLEKWKIYISLSHCANNAIAFVIAFNNFCDNKNTKKK